MKDKDLNFEKALADLESTVDKLEKGGQSLNESLALFEKGVKLARFLRDELDRAEKKVEILLKDEQGEVRARPFGQDGSEKADAAEAAEESDEDDADEDDSQDSEADAEPAHKAKAKTKPKPGKKTDDGSALPF
jgi:exodeoxyribonuclease VII small subunit